MDKEQIIYKSFLEQQLEWINEQDRILVDIEQKLYQLKRLAAYVMNNELNTIEIDMVNREFIEIREEVYLLEQQLGFTLN